MQRLFIKQVDLYFVIPLSLQFNYVLYKKVFILV